MTVTGSGFVSGSIVRWQGANRTTTFGSATSLTAAIPASDVSTAGPRTVTVFNPGPGGGASNGVTFTVTPMNPVPSVSSLNPNSATAGGAGFTLTVSGTGFVPNSVVRWNNSPRSTTFVNGTSLSAAIPAGDIASAGTAAVTVLNPAPGGGSSNSVSFTIIAQNPAPSIGAVDPTSTIAGSGAFTLTVTGSGFIPSSVVQWNGSNRATSFANGNRLTASIPASDVAGAGSASVTVFNPGPGGGSSNEVAFAIINPAPVLASINPTSATAGGPAFTLTVSGSNFVSGSVVRWNGSDRPTTFGNSAQLSAAIPASDITAVGTASVTVSNPGGGLSTPATFAINNPTPNITSIAPTSAVTGGDPFTLVVNGTNFVGGSIVRWNGSNRATVFVSNSQISASILASDLATGGTSSVSVLNPGPGGGDFQRNELLGE